MPSGQDVRGRGHLDVALGTVGPHQPEAAADAMRTHIDSAIEAIRVGRALGGPLSGDGSS